MKSLHLLAVVILVGCTTSPEQVVKSYEYAHNVHDVESALDLMSDDITFALGDVWTRNGKDNMSQIEKWDSVLNSRLAFNIMVTRGDSVFCRVTEQNDWFKKAGVDKIEYSPVVVIAHQGLIHKFIATPPTDVGQHIEEVMRSLYTWSTETNDSTLHHLLPDGKFIYSAESASRWLDLLDRWNAANTSD